MKQYKSTIDSLQEAYTVCEAMWKKIASVTPRTLSRWARLKELTLNEQVKFIGIPLLPAHTLKGYVLTILGYIDINSSCPYCGSCYRPAFASNIR